MAARKRKENESFKQYRSNLKKEASQDKDKAKGSLIWASAKFVPVPLFGNVKQLVQGTYVRAKHGSLNA